MNPTKIIELLREKEASDTLRISRWTLRRLRIKGKIPHLVLPSGAIRYDATELKAWLDSHRSGAER